MSGEFVFVHGMSHGAWCWELVQGRLETAGHRTLAVDLPGRVVAALTPQPFQPWVDRVDMRRFYAMAVPRTYVRGLRDAAIPPAKAAEDAARLGVTPVDLDTAHGSMLSAPDALAKILEQC